MFSKIEKDIISKKELFINKENKNNQNLNYNINNYTDSNDEAGKYRKITGQN